MMKRTCLLALMVMMSAASVSAADDNDKNDDSKAAASNKNKDKNDPDKVICRTDHSTSSRVEIRRTCLTRKQWADLAAQTRKDVNDFNNRMNRYQAPTNPYQGGGGVSPN
jgi:hypothetical protein